MNEKRLDELFKAYLESSVARETQYAIWETEERASFELYHIERATTAEDKKGYFLRLCKGVARDFPMLDWSMLPIFEFLDATMICNEVLYYLANPQPDEHMVMYLKGLVNRISKRVAAQRHVMPSEAIAVQTLVLLRYLRRPENRHPFFAQAQHLWEYLEHTPESYRYDYLGVRQFQDLFESICASFRSRYSKKVRQLAMRRYKERNSGKYFDLTGRYLTAHFLMTVSAENLCGMASHHNGTQPGSDSAIIQQYLDNAKQTVALLEPQLAFCEQELAFFCSCLSPGRQIMQRRYGEGTILQNDGTTISVQFSDGKNRELKLIQELVGDRITVDSNREEFEMRLFFSRNALKNASVHVPMLSEAKARAAALSSETASPDALLEMKLFQPNT